MKEIRYDIFDEVSGLVVQPFTDGLIRTMAELMGESLPDMFKIYKETIKKSGVQYFIKIPNSLEDKIKIEAKPKGSISKCQGQYFDSYEEALSFLKN